MCVCVSEFSLIVISSDRDLISRCSMSFDFWLFVCRLILEIFEVCAFRGSFLCFSSLTWVVVISGTGRGVGVECVCCGRS